MKFVVKARGWEFRNGNLFPFEHRVLLLNSVFTVVSCNNFYDSSVVSKSFFTRSLPRGPSSVSKTLAGSALNLKQLTWNTKQRKTMMFKFLCIFLFLVQMLCQVACNCIFPVSSAFNHFFHLTIWTGCVLTWETAWNDLESTFMWHWNQIFLTI